MIPTTVIILLLFLLLILNIEQVTAANNTDRESLLKLIPSGIGDGKINSIIVDKNNEIQYVVFEMSEEKSNSNDDFYVQILLITIPSILGVMATKWVVNDWQIRNDLLKTKKEILAEYDKSTKSLAVLIDNYINDSSKDDEAQKIFIKNLQEIRFAFNSFISSIRLYYRDNNMEKEAQKINDILFDVFNEIRRVGVEHSNKLKSNSEFMKFYKKKQNLHRELIKNFELKLVDTKLHKHKI